MHRFKVVPMGNVQARFHVIGTDASDVFVMANRTVYSDFDVWRDGEYSFSLRKDRCAEFWTIFQRLDPVVPN
jgi:hypothetical protein